MAQEIIQQKVLVFTSSSSSSFSSSPFPACSSSRHCLPFLFLCSCCCFFRLHLLHFRLSFFFLSLTNLTHVNNTTKLNSCRWGCFSLPNSICVRTPQLPAFYPLFFFVYSYSLSLSLTLSLSLSLSVEGVLVEL